MVKTIKITTGCRVSVTELPDWDLKERAKELDAEFIEIVRTKRMYDLFRNPVVMMVDDSGLIRNKPVNPFASFLCRVWRHHCRRRAAGDTKRPGYPPA